MSRMSIISGSVGAGYDASGTKCSNRQKPTTKRCGDSAGGFRNATTSASTPATATPLRVFSFLELISVRRRQPPATLVREALRLSDHGGHENFDYVIVARLPALTCDFTHLRQDLQRTIKQLHEKPHQKTAKTQTNTALVNSGSANSGAANFDLTHANRRKAAQPSLELKRSGPQS